MADLIKFDIDKKGSSEFNLMIKNLTKMDEYKEKDLKDALRKSASIWAYNINSKIYSRGIEKETGKLGKAMGVSAFKSERQGYIGGKARPKKASDKNGGWYMHFFARPAKQMRAIKKFPFQQEHRMKTRKVVSKLRQEVLNIIKNYV